MATATKEKPILFSGPMVRAILDGRKTQTRRVVKTQPETFLGERGTEFVYGDCLPVYAKRFAECYSPWRPGTRLWVRETWAHSHECEHFNHLHDGCNWLYRVGNETCCPKWHPSIFMPRRASRITLEITHVRVERLREVTPDDCLREGIEDYAKANNLGGYWTTAFSRLWDKINAKRGYGWEANPWVWVIEFKRRIAANQ